MIKEIEVLLLYTSKEEHVRHVRDAIVCLYTMNFIVYRWNTAIHIRFRTIAVK